MTDVPHRPLRLSTVVLVILLAMVATAAATWFLTHRHDRHAAVADRDILVSDPPTHPTVFEQATDVRQAIRRGDYADAQRIIDEVLHASHIGRWHFAPFTQFIDFVDAPSDAVFARQLDSWVAKDQGSATPWLVRGGYEHRMAWWARGNGRAASLGHSDIFTHYAEASAVDLRHAAALDPTNPSTRFLQLLAMRDIGNDAAQRAAFEESIKAFPEYYALYYVRLSELQPKWGGSTPSMYGFMGRYVTPASRDSPLKMLNLQFYRYLLADATISCAGDYAGLCVEAEMSRTVTSEAAQAASAAVKQFARASDPEVFNEVGGILGEMLSDCGCQRYSLAMLTAAADTLGSDTQLTGDGHGKNNYRIDQLVAYSWQRQHEYANAETFYKRALGDLGHAHFATANAAAEARASIYDDLADVANLRQDYPSVVAYEEASAKLRGGYGSGLGYNRLICEAQFRLKRYEDALRDCTNIIDANYDLQAQFFRARAYDALGKDDEAIRGYTLVADMSNEKAFSTYAAIAISLVHDRAHDYRKALDTLEHYRKALADSSQDRYDLASYYNDLCYDKMHLGDLQGALQDCTTSIGYKPIPDAMKKQQELVRKLSASGAAQGGTSI